MAGQLFHLGIAKMVAEEAGIPFDEQFIAGNLVVDALNTAAGSRRNTHFCGGAGCLFPAYGELRQVGTLQAWDNGKEKSCAVDPLGDVELFERVNSHLARDGYFKGIVTHLIADLEYDLLVREIYDFSDQENGKIWLRGENIYQTTADWRGSIYRVYPAIDALVAEFGGVTAEDVAMVQSLVPNIFAEREAQFLLKYLGTFGTQWPEAACFRKDEIVEVARCAIVKATERMHKIS